MESGCVSPVSGISGVLLGNSFVAVMVATDRENLGFLNDIHHECILPSEGRPPFARRQNPGVGLAPQGPLGGIEQPDNGRKADRTDHHHVDVAVRDFLTTGDGTENECGVDLIGTRDQSLGEHVGKTGSLAHDARQFLVNRKPYLRDRHSVALPIPAQNSRRGQLAQFLVQHAPRPVSQTRDFTDVKLLISMGTDAA